MKNIGRAFLAVVGLAFVGLLVSVFLFERVPPATIAVKQSQWGGGVVKEDYDAGFKWGVTGYHKWFYLDRRTHFLSYSDTREEVAESRIVNLRPPLSIRTKDNNQAQVDVTVTYRIKEGEGYMLVDEGIHTLYRDRVNSTVESVLRTELANLGSEDFVDPEVRIQRAQATVPILRERMAKYHAEPVDLLIRAVRFPPEYEAKLQQKQLTRQKALLAQAKERVADQEKVTSVIEKETEAMEKEKRADWDKRLQDARSDNNIAVAKILAEAEIYDKTTRSMAEADYVTAIAEGELALAKAEAVRNDLRNKALDTTGGRILLATEAAENLVIDEVTLNSNDPSVPTVLDVGAMVRLLVGDG